MLTRLLNRGRDLGEEFVEVDITTYASSIAYFSFVSMVPILIICISLLDAVGISEQEVVAFFMAIVPETFSDLVEGLVSDAFERSGLALSLSSLTLLWSASKGAKALRVGLNAAYAQKETRGAIAVSLISIVSGLIMDVLLVVTIYLVFSGSVLRFLATIIPGLQEQRTLVVVLNVVGMMAISVACLTAYYAYLPAGRRSFSSQLPGAICATLACGIFSFGFRVYVDNFCNSTMLYGSLGTLVMFLCWMYLIACILVVGGFLNRYLAQRR